MAVLNMNANLYYEKLQGEDPVLVEFMVPWCGYCRRIAPALEKVAQQYEDSLVIGKVNIDLEPGLADREQIEVVPTFVLYQNGQAVASMVAPDSKAKIEVFLEENLRK